MLQRVQKSVITLDINLYEELSYLSADERKLEQVLLDLAVNAIKFTNQGVKILIDVWHDLNGDITFQIADSGIEIAPEQVATALSMFGQVESTLAQKYEGTGLGLPLAKALVEQRDGTLKLQSTFGVGTTVTVRFPAARSDYPGTPIPFKKPVAV